ncbi:MAG: response regulator [Proteobacteria bacterium]|nr:response regulator [Pseudomonadota bacterium]
MADIKNYKPTILIVDDEQTNIKVLADILSDTYNISVALSGKEALQLIKSGLNPNLILLDVMMPEMDGFSVCKELKADKKTNEIPIIFVTALDDEINEEIGLKLGAVDYIYKPISPMVVCARVRIHLELQRHREFMKNILERRTKDLQKAYDDAKLMREIIQQWID